MRLTLHQNCQKFEDISLLDVKMSNKNLQVVCLLPFLLFFGSIASQAPDLSKFINKNCHEIPGLEEKDQWEKCLSILPKSVSYIK